MLIVGLGWLLTDRVIEPRLEQSPVDRDAEAPPEMDSLTAKERKSFYAATAVAVLGLVLLALVLLPETSPLRGPNGELTSFSAPIMRSIVPLIFLLFWIPGIVYGYMSGNFGNSKDMIDTMTKSMEGMAYYVVMAFFCALFIDAFGRSNIGALMALKGAAVLKSLALPGQVTIIGIIFLTAFVNLFVGSASAKWALIAPIFVPMLMQVGISAELTQAAYRVGDSSSNSMSKAAPVAPKI
jgi:p-aminobenzoyl-glutamate transporter AbgT